MFSSATEGDVVGPSSSWGGESTVSSSMANAAGKLFLFLASFRTGRSFALSFVRAIRAGIGPRPMETSSRAGGSGSPGRVKSMTTILS